MSGAKITRTPEAWAKVDPLYLMQRVANGETSGTAAYNLMRDAMSDIASLAQRCRELEAERAEIVERLGKLQTGEDGMLARAVAERDTLRATLTTAHDKLRSASSLDHPALVAQIAADALAILEGAS